MEGVPHPVDTSFSRTFEDRILQTVLPASADCVFWNEDWTGSPTSFAGIAQIVSKNDNETRKLRIRCLTVTCGTAQYQQGVWKEAD